MSHESVPQDKTDALAPFLSEAQSGSGAAFSGASFGEGETLERCRSVGATPSRADLPFDQPHDDRYGAPMLLGAGAMGRVEAVFDHRLDRVVAMKTIRAGAATERMHRRFVREAQLTAILDHPGIVPVHDAGRRADGSIYYTMRLIRGRSLAEVLTETPADKRIGELLRPFHQACEAMAFAHDRGVVHRDLKPSNIMVSEFGQVQVVDWGLARRLGVANGALDGADAPEWPSPSPEPVSSDLTAVGAIIGTPAYMSPEQARGEPSEPTTDVWALGAILFEIVHGHRLRDADSAPTTDSSRADSIPELQAILTQALAPERASRYPNGKALADDLARYLDGKRVAAHQYSTWQLVKRLVSRWRAPLLVALVALIGLGVVGALSIQATVAERDRANLAKTNAELSESKAVAATSRAEVQLAKSLTETAVQRLAENDLAAAGIAAFEALLRDPTRAIARGVVGALPATPSLSLLNRIALPDDCRDPTVSPSGDIVACIHKSCVELWSIDPWQPLATIVVDAPVSVQFSEGAGAVHIVDPNAHNGSYSYRRVRSFRVSDGTPLTDWRRRGVLMTYPSDRVLFATSGPGALVLGRVDGLLLKDAGASDDGLFAVRPGGMSSGGVLAVSRTNDRALFICDPAVFELSMDPDRRRPSPPVQVDIPKAPTASVWVREDLVMVGDVTGGLMGFDPDSGPTRPYISVGEAMITRIDATDDGDLALIIGDRDGAVLWDIDAWAPLLRIPLRLGREPQLSRDGRYIVAVDDAQILRRFAVNLSPAKRRYAYEGRTHALISPDGKWLVHGGSLGADLDVANPIKTPELREQTDISGPAVLIKDGAFSLDGRFYLGATLTGRVLIWSVGDWSKEPQMLENGKSGEGAGARRVVALKYGWVATGAHSPGVLFSNIKSSRPFITHEGGLIFSDLGASPDGVHAAAITKSGAIHRFELTPAGPLTRPGPIRPDPQVLALANDGTLVVADETGVVVLDADTDGGGERFHLAHRGAAVLDIAVDPSGAWIALAAKDGAASIWDAATGALIADLRGHDERVVNVAFDASGRTLITASWDGTVRLWDIPAMQAKGPELRRRLRAHEEAWDLRLSDTLE